MGYWIALFNIVLVSYPDVMVDKNVEATFFLKAKIVMVNTKGPNHPTRALSMLRMSILKHELYFCYSLLAYGPRLLHGIIVCILWV